MTELEAIKARHSVRKYSARPIEEDKLAVIKAEIENINREQGLHIQLVIDEPRAFSSGVLKYGQFSGVRNYIVMAGPKGDEAEEKIGYYGEKLVLMAQRLGLNTCWVGLTYKKIPSAFTLNPGEKVHCEITLGYGETQGVQHPLKPVEKFFEAEGELPGWFRAGMEAAVLAPTAVNQQKFRLTLKDGNKVEARTLFTVIGNGYLHIDLGIVKYHFEAAAGKENFTWA